MRAAEDRLRSLLAPVATPAEIDDLFELLRPLRESSEWPAVQALLRRMAGDLRRVGREED
jgi:hypothetical protein